MSRSQIFMQNSGFDKNDNLCNLLSTHLLIKRLKSLNWDNIIAIGSTVAKQQLYLPKSSYGDQCHKLVTAKLMICAKCLTLQKLFKNFAVIFFSLRTNSAIPFFHDLNTLQLSANNSHVWLEQPFVPKQFASSSSIYYLSFNFITLELFIRLDKGLGTYLAYLDAFDHKSININRLKMATKLEAGLCLSQTHLHSHQLSTHSWRDELMEKIFKAHRRRQCPFFFGCHFCPRRPLRIGSLRLETSETSGGSSSFYFLSELFLTESCNKRIHPSYLSSAFVRKFWFLAFPIFLQTLSVTLLLNAVVWHCCLLLLQAWTWLLLL